STQSAACRWSAPTARRSKANSAPGGSNTPSWCGSSRLWTIPSSWRRRTRPSGWRPRSRSTTSGPRRRCHVPSMPVEEIKERFIRDLPGVLAPTRLKTTAHNGSGAPAKAEPAGRAKKGEEGPVDLLATDDAVVVAERIPDVARYVRAALGYQSLSNLTAVDYMADGVIELVYHFLHLDGGPPLVIKTRVPRERAVVPSITPFWPGADLQEREAY